MDPWGPHLHPFGPLVLFSSSPEWVHSLCPLALWQSSGPMDSVFLSTGRPVLWSIGHLSFGSLVLLSSRFLNLSNFVLQSSCFVLFSSIYLNFKLYIRGASKIKLKKVNKKRPVTVRRVIIFLNISRHPLLICLQCCLRQYKTLKAVATATAAIVLLTPAKNFKKVFWEFLVVSHLFNHFLG